MRKLPIFYSALLLTGVNLLLRLVGTSFQVYLSGRIGAAGVGLLQLVLSVGGMALTFGMAGIRTATMYLTAEELGRGCREHVGPVLKKCLRYSLVCSCAAGATLYAAAPYICRQFIGDAAALGALRTLAVFLPASCLCGLFTGYFTAANRIGTLAIVEVAEQIFSMAVTVSTLVFWAKEDAGRACQAVVLGSSSGACLTLTVLAVLRRKERGSRSRPIPVGRRLLHAALPLALADDLKVGISTAENLMVPKRLSRYPGAAAPLALFGTVCGMVFPVLMLPCAIVYALAELLIPELARCNAAGSRRRIRYLVGRSLHVVLLYGVVWGGLLFLLANAIGTGLYANAEVGRQLRHYAWLTPMLYCDAITDAMTKGLGQQKACVRYNIFTSCMDVCLLYLVLPKYGMDGYFVSFFITHLINFLLSLRRLLKISGYRLSFATTAFTAAAALAAGWGAGFLASVPGRIAAFLLLLGSLLTLLGVISWEDARWLKGLITGKQKSGTG